MYALIYYNNYNNGLWEENTGKTSADNGKVINIVINYTELAIDCEQKIILLTAANCVTKICKIKLLRYHVS